MKILPTTLLLAAAASAASAGPLSVVATTEDLASLAREVGGDRVKVEAIARGYQDPHFVEAKPSFIVKLHGADLLLLVGKELEAGWLPALTNQARNPKIQPGQPGYLDVSQNAKIVDVPSGPITRAMGDVHPQGNPHYWLDPENGRRIARNIKDRLAQLQPADAATFEARYVDFDKRLAAAEARWKAAMAPFRGAKVVTYHRSWTNFTESFGLQVVGYVEPRPGVPPSPAHVLALIQEMQRQGVKVMIVEPYFDLKTPQAIAARTGAKVVVLPPSVGGAPGLDGFIALFDHDVKLLAGALAGR
jgi:zinc/manganese transport system substrate-binding protein